MANTHDSIKPVAWIVEFENGEQELHFNDTKESLGESQKPLYAAPQAVPAVWVSLEDGLPSPHQMVLVARESHVTTGSYTPTFGWAWEEVDGEDEDSIATHWMALPSPPKGTV